MKDAENKNLSPALRALADPTRLKILLMLEGKPRNVNEIVDFFDLSQPTISRHLQTLAVAGLVIREQRGREATYRINPESIGNVCLSLAACFPCCCVAVSPASLPSGSANPSCGVAVIKKERARPKSTRSGYKAKSQAKKRKGDTP